jgi:hypothetical protein
MILLASPQFEEFEAYIPTTSQPIICVSFVYPRYLVFADLMHLYSLHIHRELQILLIILSGIPV